MPWGPWWLGARKGSSSGEGGEGVVWSGVGERGWGEGGCGVMALAGGRGGVLGAGIEDVISVFLFLPGASWVSGGVAWSSCLRLFVAGATCGGGEDGLANSCSIASSSSSSNSSVLSAFSAGVAGFFFFAGV